MQQAGIELSQIQGRNSDVSEPSAAAGSGRNWGWNGGGSHPPSVMPDAPAGVIGAARRTKAASAAWNPRRGLLLTAEQLSGAPAPAYLLREAYVYGRRNLL